jgi:uncharacterized protein YjbI with pentapeptide repeats
MRHLPRPLLVLGSFALIIWLLAWLDVPVKQVPKRIAGLVESQSNEGLNWQSALLLIGAPVAFVIWMFRDIHVYETLANQRKDVNLKEFQELQMRAAGAMDEKLPARARETLQIAATHQLAGFLRGEYGRSFQRPAWELLRAQLLASSERMGYRAIAKQARKRNNREEADLSEWWKAGERIALALETLPPDRAGKAERAVVRDEWWTIFRSGLPLAETCFDGVALSPSALLSLRTLTGCTFVGADCVSAHLESSDLRWAHLEGVRLESAHLELSDLAWAHLEGALLRNARIQRASLFKTHLLGSDLTWSHLQGTDFRQALLCGSDLRWANLEGADLREANFQGADLTGANLNGANLTGARMEGATFLGVSTNSRTRLFGTFFDDETKFAHAWKTMGEPERKRHQALWLEKGMRRVVARHNGAEVPASA